MKKKEYSLVYKAIHGDSHAYGELIHQYNPYFYKIAFLYVKNEDAAVEIVQDSVYQGYLKIKTLRNPELFSTWMTRIIMNTVKTNLSRARAALKKMLKEDYFEDS